MRNRLELNSHASTSVAWMVNLPRAIASHIQSLVIGGGLLFEYDMYAFAVWDKTTDEMEHNGRCHTLCLSRCCGRSSRGCERSHSAFRIARRIPLGLGHWRNCVGCWRMELWMLFGSSWMAAYLKRTSTGVPEANKHWRIAKCLTAKRADYLKIGCRNSEHRWAMEYEREQARINPVPPRFDVLEQILPHP
jgi:hypothetical protein